MERDWERSVYPNQIELCKNAKSNHSDKSRRSWILLGDTMLRWALIFFVISMVAGLFGFTGISAAAGRIARILFFVFFVVFVIFLALGLLAAWPFISQVHGLQLRERRHLGQGD
jgi:uncharacterized membrane protein YtjA (UPF0391 family)